MRVQVEESVNQGNETLYRVTRALVKTLTKEGVPVMVT